MKLTQEQVARHFGVVRSTVKNWENGKSPITPAVVMSCEVWEHHLRQEDPDFGPVTLIYGTEPMFIKPQGALAANRSPRLAASFVQHGSAPGGDGAHERSRRLPRGGARMRSIGCMVRTIMDLAGGCHCGNIHVRLRLSEPPERTPVRTCTCSFCRSHNPRMISDPAGLFELSADDWSLVELYRFGTRTADFVICRHCGVFIAAISDLSAKPYAVVNVNCLDDRALFTAEAAMHEFQGETLEARTSRRTSNWMPAVVHR
jgi:hypothetical protein